MRECKVKQSNSLLIDCMFEFIIYIFYEYLIYDPDSLLRIKCDNWKFCGSKLCSAKSKCGENCPIRCIIY